MAALHRPANEAAYRTRARVALAAWWYESSRPARKVSRGAPGGSRIARLLSGAGYTLKVPAINLAEVGAGGGSIIWIDAGGALQIGPQSAGASPGPVCYDIGGTEPTLTDANVVLGYLNPEHLVGGAVKLNAAKSHSVLDKRIARPLWMSLEAAAWGAYLIAASNMIRLDEWADAPLGVQVAIASGAVNYTVQHSMDAPNDLISPVPLANMFSDTSLLPAGAIAGTAGLSFSIATAPLWMRILMNSGTGALRMTVVQYNVVDE